MFAIGPWLDGDPPPFEAELSYTTLVEYGQITGVNTQDGREVTDQFHGGAWITSGGRTAVMLLGNKTCGEVSYSSGYTPSLSWPVFLFYDPADLVAVATGGAAAHEQQPYAMLDDHAEWFHSFRLLGVDHVVGALIRGMRRGRFLILPSADIRLVWFLLRLFPRTFTWLMARLYRMEA